MEQKYFMHRIKKDNGSYVKGIEVHDTLDSAILSYHSYMKLAYNNPQAPDTTFVSCLITNGRGDIVYPFNSVWQKDEQNGNVYFMHYIRNDNGSYTKGIDVFEDYGSAKQAYHAQMEYGYENTRFPNVSFVSGLITDVGGSILLDETWNKIEE